MAAKLTGHPRRTPREALKLLESATQEELEQERAAQFAEFKQLKAGHLKELDKHKANKKILNTRLDAAKAAFEKAEKELSEEIRAESIEKSRFTMKQKLFEGFLISTADKSIDKFIRHWREVLEEARKVGCKVETSTSTNLFTGQQTEETTSNKAELDAYLAAILDATRKAEALKEKAGINVPEALAEIEKTIPEFTLKPRG